MAEMIDRSATVQLRLEKKSATAVTIYGGVGDSHEFNIGVQIGGKHEVMLGWNRFLNFLIK